MPRSLVSAAASAGYNGSFENAFALRIGALHFNRQLPDEAGIVGECHCCGERDSQSMTINICSSNSLHVMEELLELLSTNEHVVDVKRLTPRREEIFYKTELGFLFSGASARLKLRIPPAHQAYRELLGANQAAPEEISGILAGSFFGVFMPTETLLTKSNFAQEFQGTLVSHLNKQGPLGAHRIGPTPFPTSYYLLIERAEKPNLEFRTFKSDDGIFVVAQAVHPQAPDSAEAILDRLIRQTRVAFMRLYFWLELHGRVDDTRERLVAEVETLQAAATTLEETGLKQFFGQSRRVRTIRRELMELSELLFDYEDGLARLQLLRERILSESENELLINLDFDYVERKTTLHLDLPGSLERSMEYAEEAVRAASTTRLGFVAGAIATIAGVVLGKLADLI